MPILAQGGICADHKRDHMEPVVTPGVTEEEDWLLLSLVTFIGVTAGTCGFLLGWFLGRAPPATSGLTSPPKGRWPRLALRALRFIHRRRLVALAFSNYRESTLRNSTSSQPNTARRQLRARAQTPRPSAGVLNEGPALTRRHGSDHRRTGGH